MQKNIENCGRCCIWIVQNSLETVTAFGIQIILAEDFTMRNPGKHPRLKQVKGQMFTCGMFGTCSNSVLSPRTPPPLQLQEQHPNVLLPHTTSSPLKQDRVLLEKPQKIPIERQEKSTDSEVRSISERRFERVPSSTQWEFALEQEGRIKNRYLALIQRDLSPPEARVPQDRLCPDTQIAESLCLETLVQEICKGSFAEADLKNLRVLAAESEENREYMVEAGVPSSIASLLISPLSEHPDGRLTTSEEAVRLLVALSDSESTKDIFLQPEMLAVIEKLIDNGTTECKMNAVSLLLKLTSRDDLNGSLGSAPGMMEAVLKLLIRAQQAKQQAKVTKYAIKALLALCLCKENRCRAVNAGAVKALVELLSELKSVSAERALAILELLCTTPEGRTASLQHALAIPLLVSMILRVSDRGTEYAAGVLCAICTPENAEAQEMALQVCAPTQLLLLLQSDCTDRARRKALKLLKTLHNFCEESSCIPGAEHLNVSFK
ncbi:hypothetical protein O6H91_15G069100 [Diphasiastrum complanatum]|uniref:Uncharacterized protein n=1 Tax=Diphasiastrum complanatum TaxID=34168 RepID=A0ACC2BJC6_DIPCM|nr:hypothetical protein O6H91_15G069100 [Diphasiastrum complanatum]